MANTSSAVKTLKGADKNLNFTLENLNSCSWYTTWVQATKEEKGKLLESDTSTVATFKTLASGKHCNRIQSQRSLFKASVRYITLRLVNEICEPAL